MTVPPIPPILLRIWRHRITWIGRKGLAALLGVSGFAGLLGKPQDPRSWLDYTINDATRPGSDALIPASLLLLSLVLLVGPNNIRQQVARLSRAAMGYTSNDPSRRDPDELVRFTRSTFLPAYDAASAIIEGMSRGDERHIRWMSRYVGFLHRLLLPTRQMRASVDQRLSSPFGDTPLLTLLAALYEQYAEMASWIILAGYDLPMDWDAPAVQQWIDENRRLEEGLRDLLSAPAYHGSGLHDEYNKAHRRVTQAIEEIGKRRDAQRAEGRLVQFVGAAMFPVVDVALDLLRSIEAPMPRMGGTFPSYGILLTRAILEPVQDARTAVQNGLDGKDRTPLDVLTGNLFEKYQWTLTWISRGGRDTGFDWTVDKVTDLLRGDAAFREQLRVLIADRAFSQSSLAARVKQVGWGESVRREIEGLHAEPGAR